MILRFYYLLLFFFIWAPAVSAWLCLPWCPVGIYNLLVFTVRMILLLCHKIKWIELDWIEWAIIYRKRCMLIDFMYLLRGVKTVSERTGQIPSFDLNSRQILRTVARPAGQLSASAAYPSAAWLYHRVLKLWYACLLLHIAYVYAAIIDRKYTCSQHH